MPRHKSGGGVGRTKKGDEKFKKAKNVMAKKRARDSAYFRKMQKSASQRGIAVHKLVGDAVKTKTPPSGISPNEIRARLLYTYVTDTLGLIPIKSETELPAMFTKKRRYVDMIAVHPATGRWVVIELKTTSSCKETFVSRYNADSTVKIPGTNLTKNQHQDHQIQTAEYCMLVKKMFNLDYRVEGAIVIVTSDYKVVHSTVQDWAYKNHNDYVKKAMFARDAKPKTVKKVSLPPKPSLPSPFNTKAAPGIVSVLSRHFSWASLEVKDAVENKLCTRVGKHNMSFYIHVLAKTRLGEKTAIIPQQNTKFESANMEELKEVARMYNLALSRSKNTPRAIVALFRDRSCVFDSVDFVTLEKSAILSYTV